VRRRNKLSQVAADPAYHSASVKERLIAFWLLEVECTIKPLRTRIAEEVLLKPVPPFQPESL
jgi:hypothetical protein